MKQKLALALVEIFAMAVKAPPGVAAGPAGVSQFHGNPRKAGFCVDPALTGSDAAKTKPLTSLATPQIGQSYAQLLYVDRGSLATDLLVSATEQNVVTAALATTGQILWRKTLAAPVPAGSLPCGNISPYVGVTSTPVIDNVTTNSVILSAKTTTDNGTTQKYQFFALSLTDGSPLPGFPVDVAAALAKQGVVFETAAQLQRGGLLLQGGVVYAGYGGNDGDCQTYRGRVVGVNIANPTIVYSFNTTANKGAIWAPGGISGDGTSIYAGTGNTEGATVFSEGNAVVKLPSNLAYSGSTTEFFAPSNWKALDDADLDLGTAGPVVFDLPGSTPEQLLLIGGKQGIVYLLDRNNLGGFDSSVVNASVSSSVIITSPAVYKSSGVTYAAIRGKGKHCPGGVAGDLIGLKITAGNPPTINTAWCATVTAQGNAPLATAGTADGVATLWIIGQASTGYTLNAYHGATGQLLYQSAPVNGTVSRFHCPIQAKGRMYLATTNQLVGFDIGGANTVFPAPPPAVAPTPQPTTTAPTAAPVTPTAGPMTSAPTTAPVTPTAAPVTSAPTPTASAVPASCANPAEYRAAGGCDRCVSSSKPFTKTYAGYSCVQPTTLSAASTVCTNLILPVDIRKSAATTDTVSCVNPASKSVSLYLPLKTAAASFITATSSYNKKSIRLGPLRSIKAKANSAGDVIFSTATVHGSKKMLLQFTDGSGVIRSAAGHSVPLTGVLNRGGALLPQCFTAYVKVCAA